MFGWNFRENDLNINLPSKRDFWHGGKRFWYPVSAQNRFVPKNVYHKKGFWTY